MIIASRVINSKESIPRLTLLGGHTFERRRFNMTYLMGNVISLPNLEGTLENPHGRNLTSSFGMKANR